MTTLLFVIQVSPVDGTVMYVETVKNNQVEQVKGVQYSLQTFLGRGVLPKYGRSNDNAVLHTAVLYLSPGDYHHFHSPTDWSVHMYRYFPGKSLPLSPPPSLPPSLSLFSLSLSLPLSLSPSLPPSLTLFLSY